ncbi:MAG TPA: trimeric intracellular cation channel family protein [Planctomycetota bacterium]
MPSLALVQELEQFELPLSFSLLAHFTFGVTGALAGLKRGYDVIGVIFLALITAGGGGLIRDGLLISSGPASILTDPYSLYAVGAAALLTLFLHRLVGRVGRVIAVIDALGLGAFAVHGVQRSLEAGLSTPAVILGGTITAVGGGLLRDVLVREEPLLFKPGQFYALVAIGGCCLFVALLHFGWETPRRAALLTIAVVFVLRSLAIQLNWHTRALYRELPTPPPGA